MVRKTPNEYQRPRKATCDQRQVWSFGGNRRNMRCNPEVKLGESNMLAVGGRIACEHVSHLEQCGGHSTMENRVSFMAKVQSGVDIHRPSLRLMKKQSNDVENPHCVSALRES